MSIFTKLTPIANRIANYTQEHKSGISFVAGIVTQISAIVMTVDATIKAENAINMSEMEMDEEYLSNRTKWETFKDRFKVSWKYYIPVTIAEVSSITCHVVAKKEDSNRIAALSAACALSENMLKDYRNAAAEVVGEKKEALIQSKVHEKQVDECIKRQDPVYETGMGEQICLDAWGNRYFKCSIIAIQAAVNRLNEDLLSGIGMEVKLNDLYDEINLPPTKSGDKLGWITDRGTIRLTDESITKNINGIPTAVYVVDFDRDREPKHLYSEWR